MTASAWFSATPEEMARAIARLAQEDALSLPLLDGAARRRLTAATAHLPFRPARPVVGEGATAVYQEFEICMPIPAGSMFHDVAAALEALVNQALGCFPAPPITSPFRFNDAVVQRYERGDLGITAHRDHRRYQGLIVVLPLSGAARFFICADRAGQEAREIPAPPGSIVLMRGPGYAGRTDRPFHFVRDIGRRRLSLGLRYDADAA